MKNVFPSKDATIPAETLDRIIRQIRQGFNLPNNPAAVALAKCAVDELDGYCPTTIAAEEEKLSL